MKKIMALFITILLTISCAAAVFAAEDKQRVFDKAGIFSAEEANELERELKETVDEIGMDFVILTTSDKGGATLAEYSDDFYDYGGFGTDDARSGLLLLIDMEDRTVYLATTGKAIEYFNNNRILNLTDNNDEMYEELAAGEYADAAEEVIEGAVDYVHQGVPGQKKLTFFEILLSVLIPGLVAFLYTNGIKRQYAMIAEKQNTSRYSLGLSADSGFAFAVNEDALLHHNVTFRPIPKVNSSSGSGSSGTSTHTSSSGTIHGGGGGGRHF